MAAPDAIFSCDVGTPTLWAARYLAMNGRRRLLGSFNHGSMANALPQAIGAQLTHRERQVIALSGDGGLAMLMGDLLTLRRHELPVKVVVFRNDALAFVELEMKAAGILDFATGLRNPDFAKMAEAAGLLGLSAETPEQVRPMLDKALGRRRLKEDAWIRRQRPRNYCASALAPEQVPALAESADRHRAAPSCSLRALNLKSFPALPPVLLPPVFLAHALIGMTEAWASFVHAPGDKMLRMPRRNISDGVASS